MGTGHEKFQRLPCLSVPDTNSCVQTTRRNTDTIKRNGVDFVVVTPEDMQTLPGIHIP